MYYTLLRNYTILTTVAILAIASWSVELVLANHNNTVVAENGDRLDTLVTKHVSLDPRYEPADLKALSEFGSERQARAVIFDDLRALMGDAEASGQPLTILSPYRSYDYQKGLFDYYSQRYADASRFSARPGHSEHQLGTAIDFGAEGNPETNFRESFASTSQSRWLEANAWKYGFALSYPERAEDITGYMYEPWQYRYIGKEDARKWKESALVLQQFLSKRQQYYLDGSLIHHVVKTPDDPTVYHVAENSTKRPFRTAKVFFSYGFKWEHVIPAAISELDGFTDAAVLKNVNSQVVYEIQADETLRPFTSFEKFTDSGYHISDIVFVNSQEIDSYEIGQPI